MLDSHRCHPTKGRFLALFPGAFRPPHEAHLTAVLDLVSRPEIDEVVVIIANRSRPIPGATKALDAHVARRIWMIYLQDIAKVRVEIAPHAAVRHALTYFDRVQAGDQLLFCIGEADFERGDERFEVIQSLSERTGIEASIAAAPTGGLPVRATPLRAALARGASGREAFMAALPARLSATQRDEVWRICQTGMRDMSDIVRDKVGALIGSFALGQVVNLNVVRGGKIDPVCCAQLANGRRLFVKYAGDTVGPGHLGEALRPKPNRRLAAERRAIRLLRGHDLGESQLPEVAHFDKETRTLVMTDACPGGRPLLDDLKQGIFDPRVARIASDFLARCHQISKHIRPVWGDDAADLQHWKRMLALRTVALVGEEISQPVRRDLDTLMRASIQASGRHFLHLDYCPKNILVGDGNLGVIDFELSSSVGDPAYDLGTFLGHYVRWGLCTAARQSCQHALHEALDAYRRAAGDLWRTVHTRVMAFAGASLLYSVTRDRQTEVAGVERQVISTATTLLAKGVASATGTASQALKIEINF